MAEGSCALPREALAQPLQVAPRRPSVLAGAIRKKVNILP